MALDSRITERGIFVPPEGKHGLIAGEITAGAAVRAGIKDETLVFQTVEK